MAGAVQRDEPLGRRQPRKVSTSPWYGRTLVGITVEHEHRRGGRVVHPAGLHQHHPGHHDRGVDAGIAAAGVERRRVGRGRPERVAGHADAFGVDAGPSGRERIVVRPPISWSSTNETSAGWFCTSGKLAPPPGTVELVSGNAGRATTKPARAHASARSEWRAGLPVRPWANTMSGNRALDRRVGVGEEHGGLQGPWPGRGLGAGRGRSGGVGERQVGDQRHGVGRPGRCGGRCRRRVVELPHAPSASASAEAAAGHGDQEASHRLSSSRSWAAARPGRARPARAARSSRSGRCRSRDRTTPRPSSR